MQDNSSLEGAETIRVIGNIMKTNVAACSSIGSYFYPQVGRIYMDMLQMYRATSQMISTAVQRDGRIQHEKWSRSSLDWQVLLRPRRPKSEGCGQSKRRF